MSKPRVEIVVTMDQAGLISLNGDEPWELPTDEEAFEELTRGEVVVMGRKTWELMSERLRTLDDDWVYVVMNRSASWEPGGSGRRVLGVDAVLGGCHHAERVLVIGGTETYEAFLPLAERIHLTRVKCTFKRHGPGRLRWNFKLFPATLWDKSRWSRTRCEQHPWTAQSGDSHAFSFETWERLVLP